MLGECVTHNQATQCSTTLSQWAHLNSCLGQITSYCTTGMDLRESRQLKIKTTNANSYIDVKRASCTPKN